MKYFPISIHLEDKLVVVVGGGEIACRRIESLLKCGARIKVVSPEVLPRIVFLDQSGQLSLDKRPYRRGDVKGALVALTATDDREVNQLVWEDAQRYGVLLNTADEPALCDFIMPALVRRGDLTVAISTEGKSPALASNIRRRIDEMLGPEYGKLLDVLGHWRLRLRKRFTDPVQRKVIQRRIVDSDTLDLARDPDPEALERRLEEIVRDTVEEE